MAITLSGLWRRLGWRISLARESTPLHYWRIYQATHLSQRHKAVRGIRRTVRLIGNFDGLWRRTIAQTAGGRCQFGSTLFVASGPADHYVVLNDWPARADADDIRRTLPGSDRIWGLHMEPEEYIQQLGYDRASSHGAISRFYTNSEQLLRSGGIYRPAPPYVHFHIGKTVDFLRAARPPRKTIDLGIIVSDLRSLPGHKARLDFVARLDESDIDCAIWGRGEGLKRFRKYRGYAVSKWDALSRCRYSLVMENSVSPLYWSEKVADALLAFCLPIYHGCPDVSRWLPARAVVPFDIGAPDAIEQLRGIIDRDAYGERLPDVQEARQVLLEQENVYAFLDRELDAYGTTEARAAA